MNTKTIIASVSNSVLQQSLPGVLEDTSSVFGAITATSSLPEAIIESGLDYQVECINIRPVGEDETIEGFKAIRRADDKTCFNIPTDSYTIAQNDEVLGFAAPLITEAKGEWTRMGTFKGGASIFAFATLPEKLVINDQLQLSQHIVVQSSHDGSSSVTIRFLATGDETIDENLILPYNETKSRVAYRHTKNVRLRMDEISSLIVMKNRLFQKLLQDSKTLLASLLNDDQAEEFVNKLLEIDTTDTEAVVSDRKQTAKDEIMKLFKNIGHGAEGTKLGILLAVALHRSTQASTRKVGKGATDQESRFNSVLVGSNESDILWCFSQLLNDARKEVEVTV